MWKLPNGNGKVAHKHSFQVLHIFAHTPRRILALKALGCLIKSRVMRYGCYDVSLSCGASYIG